MMHEDTLFWSRWNPIEVANPADIKDGSPCPQMYQCLICSATAAQEYDFCPDCGRAMTSKGRDILRHRLRSTIFGEDTHAN